MFPHATQIIRPRGGTPHRDESYGIDLGAGSGRGDAISSGADAEWAHGLAAVYIGFSIAYGHKMVRWADITFSHRFAHGPALARLSGTDYTVACWKDVARTLLASVISTLVLFGLIWLVGNPAKTIALEQWYGILMVIFGIEVVWAVSYTIWPRPLKQNTVAI